MGMSIDKAISHLDTYSSTMGSGQTTQAQHEESKRVAIETMRKYQKIKEQVDIAIDKENFAISGARLIQIREIINGSDD